MSGRRRSIGRVVLVMVIIVVIGIVIARSYYGNVNRAVDPRILQARELYSGYDAIRPIWRLLPHFHPS